LSLRLANEGYPVWCDLTKLLGGETFWDDIQKAIKERTIKFLFVLSRSSNAKDGALQELDCAKGPAKKLKATVRDFIVPLKVDDLPHDDVHILVRRLNHISFWPSWAKGLAQLLEKLEADAVPKRASFNPEAVGSWWGREFDVNRGVIDEPEDYLSNWFPITRVPEKLYRHYVARDEIGKIEIDPDSFPYPAVKDSDITLFSFAKAHDFTGTLGEHLSIVKSEEFSVSDVIAGNGPRSSAKHLSQLFRMAWEQMMLNRCFPAHELSNRAKAFYFRIDQVPGNNLFFAGVTGKQAHRSVVGFKTTPQGKRYWHFAVQGKPIFRPEPILVVKGHVLFSDDGRTLWSSAERLHRARRSQCKNWWNDEWRDRILATMTHLGGEEGALLVPLGGDVSFQVGIAPLSFLSPVSYVAAKEAERFDVDLSRDFDEDEEPEDETGEADADGTDEA
ncbi:MAG: toll/interleukin-1 receptor domain-containing protein, partial [Terriglobia bacterium]